MQNRAALDLAFASHLANVALLAVIAVGGTVVSHLDHGSQIVWSFFLILPARVGVMVASVVSLLGSVVHWRRRDLGVVATFLAILWLSVSLGLGSGTQPEALLVAVAGAYALAALGAGYRWFRAERPSVRAEATC